MKKIIFSQFILIFLFQSLSAQYIMYINKNDNIALGAKIYSIDSLYFTDNETTFNMSLNGNNYEYNSSSIDSLSFGEESNTVYIHYDGDEAYITNPYAFEGVTVEKEGAYVTASATGEIKDIIYELSGNTANGMFKLYSDKRAYINLNNVSITNPTGPAINSQGNKKVIIYLNDNTTNQLKDGENYSTAPLDGEGEEEDQKAAVFCEGSIVIDGTGTLNITGVGDGKNGLATDDDLEVDNGTLTIISAEKDGIHAKDGAYFFGGNVTVNSDGDGLDGDEGFIEINGGELTINSTSDDVKAMKCDSLLTINDGIVTLSVAGEQSKGIKSDTKVLINGGTVNINTSGAAVLEASGSGYDPSYCTAISCDGDIDITGGNVTIKSTGVAGKGLSSDTDINIEGGTLNITTTGNGQKYTNENGEADSYKSACITSNGDVNILAGNITLSNSGSASRSITTDGDLVFGDSENSPVLNATASGSSIQISSSWNNSEYDESKTLKSDGSITFYNGTITLSSNDDAIKADNNITFEGGNITVTKSVEAVEAPYITVNNGNIDLTSSDDGFNATKGNGGESNDGSLLKITGGTIVVNSSNGDPIDSNGNL
ncbi:MAG: carbohydrate-binding domain-containing protein, partial [Saprospiraceae bacterium]